MMYVLLILCDCVFTAQQCRRRLPGIKDEDYDIRNDEQHEVFWKATSADRLTGKFAVTEMTDEQVQAIVCLGLCGEDNQAIISERLYPIAETAIIGWPNECRPIP